MSRITPRSSVCALIPHYRCERWLEQAIESLLEQTRPLDAIVVIDDGSGTPPVDIVASFPDVTLLETPENGGPYRAIQAVIDATDFDAYLFQDADDWSASDRLEALLDVGDRTGAELVGSHEVRVLVTEGDVVPVRYPLDVNAALRERPTSFPLLHPTSVIGGDLVRRLGGFATGMRYSGDAELLRRAGHVARIVNADHLGYYRRKRPGSLTLGSDTALGSPARQAVQAALAERARDNVERIARGEEPDLAPWKRTTPAALQHVCGPALAQTRRRRRRATPRALNDLPPVFVIGAPRSGHVALGWALAQHPQLRLVTDGRWLGRVAADVEARASEAAAPAPPELRASVAAALRSVAGPGGFVATGTDLLPVAHALDALFPDARFVHVVRDVDDATAALAASPTADGAFYSVDAAWRAWVAATEHGLDLEAAFGSARALRVRWDEIVGDPDDVVRRCLALVGLTATSACGRMLLDLEAGTVGCDEGPNDALARRARALSARAMVAQVPSPPDPHARSALQERFARDRAAAQPARSLVERVQALVAGAVPDGATVAVVSRGDARLLDLGGREGWHLPQVDGGTYAGHHPADSDDAVDQLDALRERGADHLVIPASSLWWLSYYDGLRRHLDDHGTVVAYHRDVGIIYELTVARPVDIVDDTPRAPRLVPVPAFQRPEVSA